MNIGSMVYDLLHNFPIFLAHTAVNCTHIHGYLAAQSDLTLRSRKVYVTEKKVESDL